MVFFLGQMCIVVVDWWPLESWHPSVSAFNTLLTRLVRIGKFRSAEGFYPNHYLGYQLAYPHEYKRTMSQHRPRRTDLGPHSLWYVGPRKVTTLRPIVFDRCHNFFDGVMTASNLRIAS